jgi:ankyrin repeat protein
MKLVTRSILSFVLLTTVPWVQAAPASKLDAALLSAAEKGDAATVRVLLKRGADANAAKPEGNTLSALMLAARGGHAQVVRLLLENGADVNATASVIVGVAGVNEKVTALMMAAMSGDAPTVKLLLDRKADPNAKAVFTVTDPEGKVQVAGWRPVLMHATNLKVLELLTESGADLSTADRDGNSVLMYAAQHLDSAAVSYLLKKGLDPKARNKNGQTAFDLAKEAGKSDNAALLAGR